MASCSNPPNKHHMANVIRFFKIILRSTLQDGNLKIPNEFTSKFSGGLPNPVFLRSPDGREWKVYWTKQDWDILFQEGWKDFAKYYSLDHGHFVVFEYEENCSHFDVHIFDMSALEIDYATTQHHIIDDDESPSAGCKPRTPCSKHLSQTIKSIGKPAIDDDDSIEILNELPPCRKKRLKCDGKSPNPQDMHQCVQTKGGNASEITSLLINPHPETTRAMEEAKEFTSENPFFKININQSYIKYSRPKLSAVFFRKYFENKNKINAIIQLGRKLWPVKLLYYPLVITASFSAGWPLFVKESKLCVGDVCIFELINRKDAVLKVHVFRGKKRLKGDGESPIPPDMHQCIDTEDGNASNITSLLISTGTATNTALEEAEKFTTENPFFMINIRQSYLAKAKPRISVFFFRRYFENEKEINAMIQLEKKLWPVKLLYYPSTSHANFSAGWPLFTKESELRAGDVCIFELINIKDAVLKVHVFRG